MSLLQKDKMTIIKNIASQSLITKEYATPKCILLVVRWPVGGIRTFMRYVYRCFDPQQYKFTILGPDVTELDVLANDLEGLNFEIIKLSAYPSSVEIFCAAMKLLMSGRYELVHSHGFTSGISAALPAFLFHTPHILTSHDVLLSLQFKGILGFMKKVVMGIMLSLVDTIHSVSYDAQENLQEFFPTIKKNRNKCVVIPNGIESERFVNAEPRNLREELGVGADVFLIGFLGRFMSQKGFVYLVDAIELLKLAGNSPNKILVVTFGEGGFVREEKASLEARGLEQYFKFLPFTANVAGVMKGLDLIVMPSLWEACGLLAMETLVAGTPLIASDCIGLREVVQKTPAYVVPSKDSKSLMEGINMFMQTDKRLIFTNFASEAAVRYNVSRTVGSLLLLIEKMIK